MVNQPSKQGRAAPTPKAPPLRLSKINYILLAAGVVAIALGYLLLSRGSITLAPLLLVAGYAVLLPLGIIR